MGERLRVFSKIIARNLPVPLDDVFVDYEALEPYGTPLCSRLVLIPTSAPRP